MLSVSHTFLEKMGTNRQKSDNRGGGGSGAQFLGNLRFWSKGKVKMENILDMNISAAENIFNLKSSFIRNVSIW